jgi:hypothetical protein
MAAVRHWISNFALATHKGKGLDYIPYMRDHSPSSVLGLTIWSKGKKNATYRYPKAHKSRRLERRAKGRSKEAIARTPAGTQGCHAGRQSRPQHTGKSKEEKNEALTRTDPDPALTPRQRPAVAQGSVFTSVLPASNQALSGQSGGGGRSEARERANHAALDACRGRLGPERYKAPIWAGCAWRPERR